MTRFNSPEEVKAYMDEVVKDDYQRHLDHGISLNPFSTEGARTDWQRGFDNAGPRSYEDPCIVLFDTIYMRGRAMAELLERMKANELPTDVPI